MSARWPTLPDVPTMVEAGVKDFVVTSWAAFVFPAGTPRAIVDKVSAAMKKIAADPDLQKRFEVAGARAIASTPEEALAYAALCRQPPLTRGRRSRYARQIEIAAP